MALDCTIILHALLEGFPHLAPAPLYKGLLLVLTETTGAIGPVATKLAWRSTAALQNQQP